MGIKKKVVMITKDLTLHGISSVVSNYCDYLPTDQYEIYILAGSEVASEYQEKYKTSNVSIIECPSKDRDAKGYYMAIYHFLKKNPTDIVHIHGNSAVCSVELMIALLCGVRKRIIHSHNTTCNHKKSHQLLRPVLNLLCTDRCACSENAGHWMFGTKPFTVIPNAFSVEQFQYDTSARSLIRKRLGLTNETVIGHVGLFNEQKNQQYLLKIFEDYHKTHENAYLLLVGDGPNIENIKADAQQTSCSKNIIFYGTSPDTAALYSAMDVFILPSYYEGLPLVLLEAQVNGLPCLVSDVVTREAYLGGDVQWLSVKDDPSTWSAKIHLSNDVNRKKYKTDHEDTLSHFQIKKSIGILESLYNQ